jgi:hypothetical protein
MLFHFYPLAFISADSIATLACDSVARMNAEVFFDPILPTVQNSSFTDFMIPKDFRLTLGAPDRQHTDLI